MSTETEKLWTAMARPLPQLTLLGGSIHESIGTQRLSRDYMGSWNNFEDDVAVALVELDLGLSVPRASEIDPDSYVTASEHGLTTRFIDIVGIKLNKAFMALDYGLRFGDVHAVALPAGEEAFPKVSILGIDEDGDDGVVCAVGEIKTPWTVPLQAMDLRDIQEFNVPRLESHIGQVVSYMRKYGLKYGWLSTYYATIFVRRADDFLFELSPPVLFSDTAPSVLQSFLGLGCMIGAEYEFVEQHGFDPSLLSLDRADCTPSECLSGYLPGLSHPRSMVFVKSGATVWSFDILKTLKKKLHSEKRVLVVDYEGTACIAKFFPKDQKAGFFMELSVYQALPKNTSTSRCFAKFLGAGSIVSSSVLPAGYILLLEKVPGVESSDEMLENNPELRAILEKILTAAVLALADAGFVHSGSERRNVMVDIIGHRVVMLDFEHVVRTLYGIEAYEVSESMAPPCRM